MSATLLHAYTPLLLWTGLGFLLFRFVPANFPKLLGKTLYWVGVPLQIFTLARQTELTPDDLWIPFVTIGVVLLSIALLLIAWLIGNFILSQSGQLIKQNSTKDWKGKRKSLQDRPLLGSLILAAMLGNTGFIGLALTHVLLGLDSNKWAVLYSVTNNVISTYGIAVFIASYFGQKQTQNNFWIQIKDVLTVPSLWAFLIGFNTRHLALPTYLESSLNQGVWIVINCALLLLGIRLASLKGWQSLKLGLMPSLIRVVIVPLLVGIATTFWGLTGESQLVLVLMAGTPTGLAVLILAEVYELDRDLLASSIALTFGGLLLMLPLWIFWFT